ALLDDRLDLIATDHAPHTLQEKGFYRDADGELAEGMDGSIGRISYDKAHAGLPLVQHSLMLMLHYVRLGRISLEKSVEKMSHSVATCFRISERGFIREGNFADLVIADLNQPYLISERNILYKCGWSPLEGSALPASVTHTFINGHLAYGNGVFDESQMGMRLAFDR
ncbi:MAG: dihydroorotase, partial [Chitinophagales bacterium]